MQGDLGDSEHWRDLSDFLSQYKVVRRASVQ